MNFVAMMDILRKEGFTDAEINHEINVSLTESPRESIEEYYNYQLIQDTPNIIDLLKPSDNRKGMIL